MVFPKAPNAHRRHHGILASASNSLFRLFLTSIGLVGIGFVGTIEYKMFKIDNDAINESSDTPMLQHEHMNLRQHRDDSNNDCENDVSENEKKWSKDRIPHVIWQTSKTKELPPEANATVSTWRQLNPNYDYQLMDDVDMDNFFRTKFSSRIYDAYRMLPFGVMKADMWRVAVIYYYGGIYADLDTIAKKPIDTWIEPRSHECDAIIGIEQATQFCNWAFAAAPKHPVFKKILDTIVDKIEHDGGIHAEYRSFVHDYTGPGIFTRGIQLTLGTNQSRAEGIIKDSVALQNARNIRLCLMRQNFFSFINVQNKFASIFWNNSKHWVRWRDDMNTFYKEYRENHTESTIPINQINSSTRDASNKKIRRLRLVHKMKPRKTKI